MSSTETIRYAVVRWNRATHRARAVVVDETKATVDGCPVLTVRQSAGPVTITTAYRDVREVCHFFATTLHLKNSEVAVVEVDHGL